MLEMKIVLRAVLARSRAGARRRALVERSRRRSITAQPARSGARTVLRERQRRADGAYEGR